MVNKNLLSYVDFRLQQIKLHSKRRPFGGISVLSVGDFYQIPPVMGYNLLDVDFSALPEELWTLFKRVELPK